MKTANREKNLTTEAQTALSLFLSAQTGIDAAAVASRWPRAWWLWDQGAVSRLGGLSEIDAFRVRCEAPQKTMPGEPTSYTVTARTPDVNRWTCGCNDAMFRVPTCKHQLAVWLYLRLGENLGPGRRGQHQHKDTDYEAWLASLPDGRTVAEQDEINEAAVERWGNGEYTY